MKMVNNARQAWRWFSVQAMVASLAIQSGWQAMPPDMADRIPDGWATGVSIAALLFGIAGRMVDQGGNDD